MKSNLIYFFIIAFIIGGCGADPNKISEFDLEKLNGSWELTTEVINNTEIDCSTNPIKTIFDFKEGGYYILYDDLSSLANQSDLKVRKEVLKQGQFNIEDSTINLLYTIQGQDREFTLTLRKLDDSHLEIFNPETKLLSKYSKK